MKVFSFVLSAGLAFCLLFMSIPTSNVHAQGASLLEEIVVTARRREENLMEVPVSVSVLGSDLLMDPSVVDQFDLYELTPGISYDQSQDRQAARASVRGVWTRAQNPIRAKVTSFVDGVPNFRPDRFPAVCGNGACRSDARATERCLWACHILRGDQLCNQESGRRVREPGYALKFRFGQKHCSPLVPWADYGHTGLYFGCEF